MVHICLPIRVLLIIVFVGYAMQQTHQHSGNGSSSGGKVIATSNITDQSSGSLSHVVIQQHSTLHRHDKLMSDMSQYNWSGLKHFPTKGLVRRETHGRGIQGQQQHREHATDFVSVGDISPLDGAGHNGLKIKTKLGGYAAQRQQATIAPNFASTADSLLEHADIVSVAPIKAVIPDASVINKVLAQNSYESKDLGAYTDPLKRNSSNDTQRHRHHRDRASIFSPAGDVIPMDGIDGSTRSEPHILRAPARRGLLRREGKHRHGHLRMREPQEGQNDSPNLPTSLSVSEQAPTVVPTAAAAMLTLAPQTSSGSSQGVSQTASPVTEPAQSAEGGSSWPILVLVFCLGMGVSCVALVVVKRGRFEEALGMQPMSAGLPVSRGNSQNFHPHRWTRFAGPEARSPESSTTLVEERHGTASSSISPRFSPMKKSKSSASIMHGDDSPVTSPTNAARTRLKTPQVSRSNSESMRKKNDSSLTVSSETPRTVSPERTNRERSPPAPRCPRTPRSQSKTIRTRSDLERPRPAGLDLDSHAHFADESPDGDYAC